MKNKEERYKVFEYEITSDSDFIDNQYSITPEIKLILQQTHEKVQRKKNSVLRELHTLIEKYPHIPQFKNQLSTLYALQNNFTKANEVNHWLLKEHPDYLFGRLNLANEYIADEEYEKVPEVLGELLEIKDLYPERNIFHVNEVTSFYQTAILYFLALKNIEAAESRLEMLKKINDGTVDVAAFEFQLMAVKMETGLERWEKDLETAKSVKPIAKKVVEPTSKPPVFHHKEIEQLYCNSMRISHEVLKEILGLPRETLINDLHKVVYDSMARYKYFSKELHWNESTHEIIIHALFLLDELKSESSLHVVLDILRQSEKYLQFWFVDFLTEDMWQTIYNLGFNQLNALKDFMMEPDLYCYARSEISVAVSQMALNHPEWKEEVLQWYNDILSFYIAQKDNERIIDSTLNGLITGDLLDINATGLEPLIIKLYNLKLAGEGISGSLSEVLKELHNPKVKITPRKRLNSIFDRYNDALETWLYYKDENISHNANEEYPAEAWNRDFDYPSNTTYIRTEAKIGRNDPCPCGSGLKYKKCHGK